MCHEVRFRVEGEGTEHQGNKDNQRAEAGRGERLEDCRSRRQKQKYGISSQQNRASEEFVLMNWAPSALPHLA